MSVPSQTIESCWSERKSRPVCGTIGANEELKSDVVYLMAFSTPVSYWRRLFVGIQFAKSEAWGIEIEQEKGVEMIDDTGCSIAADDSARGLSKRILASYFTSDIFSVSLSQSSVEMEA